MRVCFIVFIALVMTVFAACARPVKVEGTAMSPTLQDGDRWITSLNVGELGRGDIISFRYPKDESKRYVKRIVGLPGEKVEIRGGVVIVNGSPLTESYVDSRYNQAAASFPEKNVAENHYYVLGDNRDNSSDSRYWGTVDRSLIEGKLYYRYYSGEKAK